MIPPVTKFWNSSEYLYLQEPYTLAFNELGAVGYKEIILVYHFNYDSPNWWKARAILPRLNLRTTFLTPRMTALMRAVSRALFVEVDEKLNTLPT